MVGARISRPIVCFHSPMWLLPDGDSSCYNGQKPKRTTMARIHIVLVTCVMTLLLVVAPVLAADENVKAMVRNIHWLGHDTYKIFGQKTVYTEPFKIKKQDVADIILITHPHQDHCSPVDVKKVQGPGTVVVTTADCATILSGTVKVVKPGDKLTVASVEIEAVPAYNTNKQFHTIDKDWVGFIFTLNGVRMYLAGDTDYIPEMKSFKNVGIAFIPVSGTYVTTAEEAVKATLDINPQVAIPMHYGAIVGSKADAERFARALKGKVEVVVLEQE